MIVILSNGTQIAEYKMDNGATDAVVLPDGRATTEEEWQEYAAYVKNLSLTHSRERLAKRLDRNKSFRERPVQS
jgi:hypothetical protein